MSGMVIMAIVVLVLATAGRWTLCVRRRRREEDRRWFSEEQIWWSQLHAAVPGTPAGRPTGAGQVPAG